MKRSVVLFSLFAILALMVVACGGGGPTQAPPAQATAVPPAAQNTSAPQATNPPAAQATNAPQATTAPSTGGTGSTGGGEVKLNTNVSGNLQVWHFWGSQLRRGAIRRVIGICQAKLPNIKVTDTFKPFGDIWTANTAAVAAGSGMPDIIVEDRPSLYQRGLDKIETDLQPYIDKDSFDKSAFLPFTWEQTLGPDGHPYGIPFETDVRVLYWDKNVFKDAGLDPEKAPETWDDMWNLADKLDKKNPDGTYARIAFMPLWNVGPDIWMYTNGGSWVKDGKPVVNSPEAVETFAWIKKWVDRYGGWDAVQKFQAQFGAPPNDAFMSGKVAMVGDIQGYVSQITFFDPRIKLKDASGKETNDRLDYGITDLPHAAGKPKGTWSGGFALSIPRGSKNADAAWEFIKCMTGPEGESEWARSTFGLAPNIAANTKDPGLAADPRWQFFLGALKNSKVEPFVKAYPAWTQEIQGPVQESIWKGQDVKAALDAAQKKIDDQIAKAK